MATDGELVERGTFRVDRAKALEKLSRFRLTDEREFLLSLVRTAVLSGAKSLSFDMDLGRLIVAWDGEALAPELMADPLAGLLGNFESRAAPHVGAAFLGALQAGAVEVEAAVRSPGREEAVVWRGKGEDARVPVPQFASGTRLAVRWKGVGPLELFSMLRSRCSGAPLRLTVEGSLIEAPPTAVELPMPGGTLRVWPAPADALGVQVRPYVAGAGVEPVELDIRLPPLAGSLMVDGLTLDASLSKVVHDPALFEAAREAAFVLRGVVPHFAQGHRTDLSEIQRVLQDAALRTCWAAESGSAKHFLTTLGSALGIGSLPDPARMRWTAHASRRTRWLQVLVPTEPELGDLPLFPTWGGPWLSRRGLSEVAGGLRRLVVSSTMPDTRYAGTDESWKAMRLYKPGDFQLLAAAAPELTLLDASAIR